MSRTKYRTTPDPRYPNLGHNCAKCGIWLYTKVGEDWFCPSCADKELSKGFFAYDTPLALKIVVIVTLLIGLVSLGAMIYVMAHPRAYTCTQVNPNLIVCQ